MISEVNMAFIKKKVERLQYVRVGLASASIPLKNSKICAGCDMIHDGDQCPRCCSVHGIKVSDIIDKCVEA
jgi:hypothetical protein